MKSENLTNDEKTNSNIIISDQNKQPGNTGSVILENKVNTVPVILENKDNAGLVISKDEDNINLIGGTPDDGTVDTVPPSNSDVLSNNIQKYNFDNKYESEQERIEKEKKRKDYFDYIKKIVDSSKNTTYNPK